MESSDAQTANSIRKSFAALSASLPRYTDEYYEATRIEGSGYSRPFSLHGDLTIFPVMFGTDGGLRSAHEHTFGFYALRTAVRGLFLSVQFSSESQHALGRKRLGPAVLLGYTSAYHTLHALLALRGCVYSDSDDLIWPLASQQKKKPSATATRLSSGGQWRPGGCRRSHTQRWLEVDALFKNDLGQLHDGFSMLYEHHHPESRVDPALLAVSPAWMRRPRKTLAEALNGLLRGIAEVRHRAHYLSSGSDPGVVDAQINREKFDDDGIERTAELMVAFAAMQLRECAKQTSDLLPSLQMSAKIREVFFLSCYYPPFDSLEEMSDLPDTFGRPELEYIREWISVKS